MNFGLVCYYTLMVFVAVDIGTVIYGQLNEDLGISFEVCNISFGVNTAGLAVGCILFIPFALKFGRRPVYLMSIAVSLATCIWQGKMQTSGDLLGSNLVAGLAGATAETICQMSIADMFFVHQRGAANAVYLFMVNIGAFLSLIPAGYVAASQGWRWIWWWSSILLAACFLLFFFLYEDTKYTPVTYGVRQENDDVERSFSTPDEDAKGLPQVTATSSRNLDSTMPRKSYIQRLALVNNTPGWQTFFRHTYQPFIILATFPAITFSALTYGSLLAWFSMAVTTYSVYFTLPPYNFGSEGIGLMNLPPFIGGLIGSLFAGIVTDRSIIWLARRNGGVFEPEMRLWTALPGVVIMPFSLLWFGFSTADGNAWIVPAVALGFFGFGFVVLGDVALTYAMDSYTDVSNGLRCPALPPRRLAKKTANNDQIVGDAFIGIVFVRNVFATIIATTLTQWIDGIGLKNVFVMGTVLGLFLSLLTIPMMIWGKRMRVWTKDRYAVYAARQYASRAE